MGFLFPWFLAGAAAVGLPIYLHLLRRHQTTPRPFSSLMFFEPRTQSSIKHRRLRYLLLLSLRLALLLLLALAFADPYISRPVKAGGGDKLLLLVIDDSFSMRAGSHLADARQQALSLLSSRSPSTRAQVMAFGSALEVMTDPTRDPGALRAAVERIEPEDSRGSLLELARGLRSLTATVHTPIELHFFSDMQRSAMPANFAEMALPANVLLVLHPVATAPAPNWTVESVNAPGRVWNLKNASVSATVAGYNTPPASRMVSLVVNGKTIATRRVDVPASGRVTVQFPSLDVPYGFSRCAVTIDSADSLAADDQSIFAVERSDPEHLLFIHQAGDTRSPLYFEAALSAAADSVFLVQTATVEQAATIDVSKYPLVVLSNALQLPSSLENSLTRYVRDGGSVLEAAGSSGGHASGIPIRIPILGNRILELGHTSNGGDDYLTVGKIDPSHPSLSKTGQWAGVRFYQAVRVDPGNSRVVASLSDGTPLLLDATIGEGHAMLLTSGLDGVTNDLPLHPVFVPFVEQTARYLSGTGQHSGARLVDSFLDLRTAKEQSLSVEVIDPDGSRPLSLKQSTSAQTYQLPRAGFYQLRLANGRQDLVGVNADPRESDLDVIPADVLALWRGSASPSVPASVAESPTVETRQPTQPYSLGWYIMILLLAAAFAEASLASRYLGTQREEP